ncbi:MAG TPA: hypothetical protein VMN79_17790 [Casimicrobiaceae bacterium]|nr:hypothetical protein [Casimicrobiaceae bacterium]
MAAGQGFLARYARPADSLGRELAAFEKRVDAFAGSLERVVRNALEAEAEAVSADWLDEAKAVLDALREHPDGSGSGEADCHRELSRLRASFAKGLDRDLLKPSAGEIAAQTRNIARAALDEWMTRLTRAHLEAAKKDRIFLNAEAMPADESLTDLLSRVEVFGVPAETVAAALFGYICHVVAGEQRFTINEELYILEDMNSRDYLLVVEGTRIEPAPIDLRFGTAVKELIVGEELASSAVLPREPAEIGEDVFLMTRMARKLSGNRAFPSAPLERVRVCSAALTGALSLHPQVARNLFTGFVPEDPVLDRFTEHFAAITEAKPKQVRAAMKVVLKRACTGRKAKSRTAATEDLMRSVIADLKTLT